MKVIAWQAGKTISLHSRVGFLEHLSERLPGCFAEQTELLGMVFENGA
jgi:hypothetical protein